MDPAESLDDALQWWKNTGRKCFWSYLAGIVTPIILMTMCGG